MTWRLVRGVILTVAASGWTTARRQGHGRRVGPVPSSRRPGGDVAGRGRAGPAAGAHAAAAAAGSRRKAGGRGFGRQADRASPEQPGRRAGRLGIGPGQTGAAERLRDHAPDRRPRARAVEQAAGCRRPSGDDRGPDAHAAPQGAGGRRCDRGRRRERPDRGLEALRSRGWRQGLRRRRGVAAGRSGVLVRRAGRKRRGGAGRHEVHVHPVENPRTVEDLAGAGGAVEGLSQAGHVGR